jgi:peptide/nickel transport system substrate-binding protein
MDNTCVHVVGQGQGSLDPAEMIDTMESQMAPHLYDPLFDVDPDAFAPVAHLITEWESSDEGKLWRLTLRDDVSHQSGNDFTAEDVAYSFERVLNKKSGFASIWLGVIGPDDLNVVDEQTLEISFDKTYGPFIASLVLMWAVDKATLQEHEEDGDWGTGWLNEGNTAGTGPYMITNWERGSSMSLKAFEDYWKGWEDNQFGNVVVESISETSTALNKMRLGEGDTYNGSLSNDNWQSITNESNVAGLEAEQLRLWYCHMNTTKKPFEDKKVREAFSFSLDYESVVNDIIGGGQVAAGPVPRTMGAHSEKVPVSTQDPERAKQALEDSSYTAEEINQLEVTYFSMEGNPVFRQTGLLLQSNVSEILGIDIQVETVPWTRIAESNTSSDSTPHLQPVYQTAKFPSPYGHTHLMWHPDAFGSYSSAHWYEDEEIVAKLEEARSEPDAEARAELYKEAQMLIYESFTIMPIANPPYRNLANANLGSWEYIGLLGWDLRAHYLTREGDGRAK